MGGRHSSHLAERRGIGFARRENSRCVLASRRGEISGLWHSQFAADGRCVFASGRALFFLLPSRCFAGRGASSPEYIFQARGLLARRVFLFRQKPLVFFLRKTDTRIACQAVAGAIRQKFHVCFLRKIGEEDWFCSPVARRHGLRRGQNCGAAEWGTEGGVLKINLSTETNKPTLPAPRRNLDWAKSIPDREGEG